MKKLGKLKLNPEKMLSHDELVSFRGGSGWNHTCGWSGGGIFPPLCGISKSDAMDLQMQYGGWWCCDSCCQTSYCWDPDDCFYSV